MVYAQPRINPGKYVTQIPLGFSHTNGSPTLGQTTSPSDEQEKQEFAELGTLLSRLTTKYN